MMSSEVVARSTRKRPMRSSREWPSTSSRIPTDKEKSKGARSASSLPVLFSIIQKNVPTRAAEGARKGSKWQRSRWLPTDFLTCNEWSRRKSIRLVRPCGNDVESSTSDIFLLIFHDRPNFDDCTQRTAWRCWAGRSREIKGCRRFIFLF
jgi:hypothetical protein